MDESRFRRLMGAATALDAGGEYARGYQHGLRRAYHGERFGTPEEHARWDGVGVGGDPRLALGRGYRDGLAGQDPTPALGDVRRARGDAGVRDVVAAALEHADTAMAAAASFGTDASTMRRAYERAGGTWPEMPRGRPPRAEG